MWQYWVWTLTHFQFPSKTEVSSIELTKTKETFKYSLIFIPIQHPRQTTVNLPQLFCLPCTKYHCPKKTCPITEFVTENIRTGNLTKISLIFDKQKYIILSFFGPRKNNVLWKVVLGWPYEPTIGYFWLLAW